MDQKLVALVAIGVLASMIGWSEAITCYSCDSRTSSKCLDPFSSSGVSTCSGASCSKAAASGNGVTIITRGCDPTTVVVKDECADVSVSGVNAKGCLCGSELCNDGGMLTPMYKIVVALTMAAIIAIGNKI